MAIDPYQGGLDLSTIADNASRAAYNDALARNLGEQLALDKAKQAWLQTYQTASLTGNLNGTQTLDYARVFGQANGTDSLAKIAQQAALTGQYGGNDTEATREFNVGASGYMDPSSRQQLSLAGEAEQNKTALGYLQLLAGLRGPANAFQYAKVLSGTPNGMADIVNAASGRFNMPASGGSTLGGATSNGAVQPNGTSGASIGANGQLQSADLASLVGSVRDPNAAYQPPATGALPLPNQIDAQAWQRFNPTQKDLLNADYENQGMDPRDVDAMRQKALPQYGGATRGGVTGLFG